MAGCRSNKPLLYNTAACGTQRPAPIRAPCPLSAPSPCPTARSIAPRRQCIPHSHSFKGRITPPRPHRCACGAEQSGKDRGNTRRLDAKAWGEAFDTGIDLDDEAMREICVSPYRTKAPKYARPPTLLFVLFCFSFEDTQPIPLTPSTIRHPNKPFSRRTTTIRHGADRDPRGGGSSALPPMRPSPRRQLPASSAPEAHCHSRYRWSSVCWRKEVRRALVRHLGSRRQCRGRRAVSLVAGGGASAGDS